MKQSLIPPFNLETARLKVQRAEDLWNGRSPTDIAQAYTENSGWRNRSEFVQGREASIKERTIQENERTLF